MERRDFLKLAGMSGMALMSPFGLRHAFAARRYEGPYFLLVHAGGGWDPTYLCDPKGKPINNLFTSDQIGQVGNFKFAPIEYKDGNGNVYYTHEQFFTKFKDKLCVINGLDTTTGNHDTGTRAMWSGRVAEGYPTFAALLAGAKTPGNPLGFISSGGYEVTGGLVPLTRLGNVDSFRRIAYPNRVDPNNPSYGYMSDETLARIRRMQRERLDDMRVRQGLPRLQRSMSSLYLARQSDDDVATLAAALPSQGVINQANNDILRQALVAISGFQSGLAVAANLITGGFDTHGNHDGAHLPRLYNLISGVDRIMDAIVAAGLEQKVIVAVGSDFGRTPTYNAQAGKDHWNITSMLLMGPGIPGGRVIGGSDANFKALTFNARTLQPDASGTRIRCEHVQLAMRRVAGITDSEAARKYPINAEEMPLFS